MRGEGAAHEAVESQQEEQAHQGLGALDDVGDAFGLEGVDEPDGCHGRGQPGGSLRVAGAQRLAFQGAAHDAEEQQAGQEVDGEVEGMVAPNVQPAEGIVDRQGELHERASGMRHYLPRGPEMADLRVVEDAGLVVEDEAPGEAVEVCGEPQADQQQWQRAPASPPACGDLWRRRGAGRGDGQGRASGLAASLGLGSGFRRELHRVGWPDLIQRGPRSATEGQGGEEEEGPAPRGDRPCLSAPRALRARPRRREGRLLALGL